jgi:hypothetical protein
LIFVKRLNDNWKVTDEIPVTATVSIAVTVILLVAVNPPSAVVAVIVAEPAATPVTTPEEFTVATPVALEDHVIV